MECGHDEDAAQTYDARSWLRIPTGETCELATRGGCVLYIKTGALGSLQSVSD